MLRQLTAPCELQLCLRVGSSTSDSGWRRFRSKPTGAQTEFLKRSRNQSRYASWPQVIVLSRWRESFMSSGFALLLAFGIGVVAGLRSMTAPAGGGLGGAIGWVSRFRSSFAFLGTFCGGGL